VNGTECATVIISGALSVIANGKFRLTFDPVDRAMLGRMGGSLERLHAAVIAAQRADSEDSRTARLLRAGRAKMAKKLGEEAIEVVLESMHGNRDSVVRESADLLYNLVVLWVALGVRLEDVWREMDRRERLFGIAEKLLKPVGEGKARRKATAVDAPLIRGRCETAER
jgi:phosphoribosyl-ATP pyrophosphohydrolase